MAAHRERDSFYKETESGVRAKAAHKLPDNVYGVASGAADGNKTRSKLLKNASDKFSAEPLKFFVWKQMICLKFYHQ